MLNLSRTIDRVLKIEPSLEAKLLPIKNRYEKNCNSQFYWKRLIDILNANITSNHPKYSEIQNIFKTKRKYTKKLYSFEPVASGETIVGVIPENIEGKLLRHDRTCIKYAKLALEANLTHNSELRNIVLKKQEKLALERRKIFFELKDHFNLWKIDDPFIYLNIRRYNSTLVLTMSRYTPNPEEKEKIPQDMEWLKKLLRYLNIIPPENNPENNNT